MSGWGAFRPNQIRGPDSIRSHLPLQSHSPHLPRPLHGVVSENRIDDANLTPPADDSS
jgi:hypothetical protein